MLTDNTARIIHNQYFMKNYIRYNVIILIILQCILPLYGYKNISYYTIDDGLYSNAVYSITQDSKKRMWFGTIDGLHSFDGNRIKVWRNSSISTLGSNIYTVVEDSCFLYIGSDKGLSLLNMKTEEFMKLNGIIDTKIEIHTSVSHIMKDSKGRIWISTMGQGLFCLNPKMKDIDHYMAPTVIQSDYIYYTLEDSDGNIWATTKDAGILCYSDNKKTFKTFIHLSDNAILTIFEDSRKRLWVGGFTTGLSLVDKKQKTLKSVHKSDKSVLPLPARSIIEPEQDILWIATDNGLLEYNINKDEGRFIYESNNNERLSDKHLQTIYVDGNKGIWIGTYFGGVNHISYHKQNFVHHQPQSNGLNAKIISVFAHADNGNLWIGTDDEGVFYWDRTKNIFIPYTLYTKGKKQTYKNTHAILQDNNMLFIGTYMGGLDVFNLSSGEKKNYQHSSSPNSLYSSSVYSICKDSENNIWIGTTSGLNRYIPSKQNFERIYEVSQSSINDISEDKNKNLWVCTYNKGVFCKNRDKGEWIHYDFNPDDSCSLPCRTINTSCVDDKGNIWFGSDGDGLVKYEAESECFKKINLPEHIRVINKILVSNGIVWMTTSNGMFCFDEKTNSLKSYDKNDGLQGNQFMPNSGIQLPDGTICIGGTNGFNEFNPQNIENTSQKIDLILSDFELFNKPVRVLSEDSPLTESITYAKELKLSYKQSMFSFSVANPNYDKSSQCLYRYQLEGFEKEWTESAEPPHVTYTNLPPGLYTFRVKAANSEGIWNNNAISLNIRVLPPWWFSVPMIIIYILGFIGSIFYLIHRINKKHRQRILMLTIEKDKEIYQSKIDFFTNIMHEIRTPLTLILAPLESAMKTTGNIDIIRPKLQIIEKNGLRLLNLVNQLMDFQKAETGNMQLNLRDCNLKVLTENVSQQFKAAAQIKNVNITTAYPEEPCYARVDTEAFTKVISNLLSNALKFTDNHIWINISITANNQIEIEIKDNGHGIAEQEKEKIFMPFYQISNKNESDNNKIGTGIGLSFVKKLVDQMNGKIKLESELGKGSAFSLYFDLIVPEETSITNEMPESKVIGGISETEDSEGDNISPKYNILIVDDNADLREYLVSILSDTYSVVCSNNGLEAWKSFNKQLPDIVISDVMMPEMNGYELCKKIKGSIATSHIPVVLLTAKATQNDYVEGFDNGADVYLEKPFSEEVLKAQIRSIIKNKERLRNSFKTGYTNNSASSNGMSKLDKQFIDKITKIIEKKMTDTEFNIDLLIQDIGISRSGLFTKIKALTGMTPNDYIRLIRLKKAASLLINEDLSSSEACFQVGFSSPSYFSKCFQEQFGMSPSEFKKKSKINNINE